jgi:hypothetical protein
VQGSSLFFIEVVPATVEHLVESNELDHLPFGQVGGLVEDETTVVDMGSERLHGEKCTSQPHLWPRHREEAAAPPGVTTVDGEARAVRLLRPMGEELGEPVVRLVLDAEQDIGEVDLGLTSCRSHMARSE